MKNLLDESAEQAKKEPVIDIPNYPETNAKGETHIQTPTKPKSNKMIIIGLIIVIIVLLVIFYIKNRNKSVASNG